MSNGGDFIDLIKSFEKIAPDALKTIETRYEILKNIEINQPLGRRAISLNLGLRERTVRYEVEKLRELKLLTIDNMGMYVTDEAKKLLSKLEEPYYNIRGIGELIKLLQKKLHISKIVVVPGDSEINHDVLLEMGKAASKILLDSLGVNDIVGVTGGSTMACVSKMIHSEKKYNKVTIIPARGGLGTEMTNQANSVAANIGKSLDADYRMLHIPDGLDQKALKAVSTNPEIREVLQMMDKMNILLFGIGRADELAQRRRLPIEKIDNLLKEGAVAEAFGHYFNINGRDIWEYKTVGISLGSYKKLEKIIGVAGGKNKAEAIIAVSSIRKDITLVIDEAVGYKILELLN
ncbi:MAG: sugar-binding domain-containing protein [Gudongella sp.]|nr:sugar-binding domain-containing protein [Gudongella sp.]